MKYIHLSTILFAIMACTLISCKSDVVKSKDNQKKESPNTPTAKGSDIKAWAASINSKDSKHISEHYASDAIQIVHGSDITQGADNISSLYASQTGKVANVNSLFKIEANAKSTIVYEIVRVRQEPTKDQLQLVIWKKEGDRMVRQLEYTADRSREGMYEYAHELTDRRNSWMEKCNNHNVESLVHEIYSPDAIYYNHKPLVRGEKNIVKEYDYMTDENYQLKLTPYITMPASNTLAFEIGQGSGSYNGKYILIWEKNKSGIWEIVFDSNI